MALAGSVQQRPAKSMRRRESFGMPKNIAFYQHVIKIGNQVFKISESVNTYT